MLLQHYLRLANNEERNKGQLLEIDHYHDDSVHLEE
jgi:hypothetical protein